MALLMECWIYSPISITSLEFHTEQSRTRVCNEEIENQLQNFELSIKVIITFVVEYLRVYCGFVWTSIHQRIAHNKKIKEMRDHTTGCSNICHFYESNLYFLQDTHYLFLLFWARLISTIGCEVIGRKSVQIMNFETHVHNWMWCLTFEMVDLLHLFP
jgi:hypothetical protein